MRIQIGSVVEGHGESLAIPVLMRRIAADVAPTVDIEVVRPFRRPRSLLVKPRELEKAVEAVALGVRPAGAVLIVIDSDDDCPKALAAELLGRARASSLGLPVAVVLAQREFESWFLAAAESLRGCRGLPNDLHPPERPEEIRGAKAWLQSRMSGRAYSETVDQPAFTALMDLNQTRSWRSFDKCYREVSRLIQHVAPANVQESGPRS